MSYTKNGSGTEIIEESNYYPFGLKHQGYNQSLGNPSYKYQYNGKELQEETGWSDFGARMYMSDIGRWGVIDPLAETSRRFTPYNFAYNNPISFIDPDGRKAMAVDESWSWNTPVDSGWFTMGSSRRKFGSLDEFVEMTSSNEREKGSGGGTPIGESITYNEALTFLGLTPGGVDFSQFDFSQFLNDNIDDGGKKKTAGDNKNKQYGNVFNFFSPTDDKDYSAYTFAQSVINGEKEPNTITIFGHGSEKRVGGMNAEQLHKYLLKHSPLYQQSIKNGRAIDIQIKACFTGLILAKELSILNPNATVSGATDYWIAKSFLWFAWDAGLRNDAVYNRYRNGNKIK